MDRFDCMRVFVRVVEAGSFTKAAETLDISRATVTQSIQQLEAHLRIKLLNRTTRKVNITKDGAAYFERVVKLLNELEDIEHNLPGSPGSPRGLLRVDVPSPFANIILVPALPDFYARFPDIQLELGASDRKVDLISDNVDCVVRGGEITDGALIARHVGNLQLGVYAAPSYLKQSGTPLHPHELIESDHRIIRYRWANELPYGLRKDGVDARLQGRSVLEIDDGNAYLTAGLAGLGVQWLPEYMAKRHIKNGELVRLFSDWQFDSMPLYVAYSPNRYASKQLRVFIEWITHLIAQHANAPQ